MNATPESPLIPAPTAIRPRGGSARIDVAAIAQDGFLKLDGTGYAWLAETVTAGWCGARAVDAQSYRLSIERGEHGNARVRLESPTRAGLRHGRATIRQLCRIHGPEIPLMSIEDRPVFAVRGVMLDVSRCRVQTMPEFFRIVDSLAELKCNHLQLYTEHTFAYAGHEEVWRGWSPMQPHEVVQLDDYCRSLGIELAANQNCFGHLRNWLERPRYAHLAETHGDWMFDVWPRSGPFSLCPTDPASLRFVEDLLGQLLPCFHGGLVNIGCDETYDIAYGRSKEEVVQRGRPAVYLDFVRKIADIARRHAKRPMFWGDIALSHPECVADIPEDMISLAWGYEPDAPFARWCELLRNAGREVWVCPGTSSWCSITGRTQERTANIFQAAKDGAAGGASGFLICDWGDWGHWQQWPVAMLGIAQGLHAAWSGAQIPFSAASASIHALGDPTASAGSWLEQLGDTDIELRSVSLGLSRPGQTGRLRNQTAIFADLRQALEQSTEVGPKELWIKTAERLHACAANRPATGNVLLDAELGHTASLAIQACNRAIQRRVDVQNVGAWRTLADAWQELRDNHRRLWLQRCRDGGLEQSCAYFDKVISEMRVRTSS